MSTINLTCSEEDLFLIVTYLVKQSGGDGDCTIICNEPTELADRYEKSRLKPKEWKRILDAFFDGHEYMTFSSDMNCSFDTFKIYYMELA